MLNGFVVCDSAGYDFGPACGTLGKQGWITLPLHLDMMEQCNSDTAVVERGREQVGLLHLRHLDIAAAAWQRNPKHVPRMLRCDWERRNDSG